MNLFRRARSPMVAAVALLGVLAAPQPAAADRWADRDSTVETVGKIIWDEGKGRLGMCSGAIVDAPNGSVIATAAHCVHDTDRPHPPRDAYFVPAYDHDKRHYRRDGWRIESYHTPDGWDVSRDPTAILPHDYAFLTVESRRGQTIQEVYGANRLAFEPVEEGRRVTVLGYPAVEPYDGESLHYCEGRTEILAPGEADEANVGGLMLAECDLTAGSSGGPWLTDYDEATETGTVVAVMSVGSGEGEVVGRPFPVEGGRALLAEAGGERSPQPRG